MNKMEVFNELIKREPNFLDKPLEELVPISYIGQAAVDFCRDKMKLMKRLDVAEEQKKLTLKDGQDAGKMLLDIEARIGELYHSMPNKSRGADRAGGKTEQIKEVGIDQRTAHRAETIYKHPEAVAEVIKEAEENEDIPTKTAVLKHIALQKEKERRKEKEEKSTIQMRMEVAEYKSKLLRVINILPTEPPKELTEDELDELSSYCKIIYKRIKEFIDAKTFSSEEIADLRSVG